MLPLMLKQFDTPAILNLLKPMKKYLLLIGLPLLVQAVYAQETETRRVDSFHELEAGGSFDVIIEQGEENVIRIEARNIDPAKIKTEVRGDVLRVYQEKGDYKNMRATVYITYENLDAISGSGSGNLICKSPLAASTFDVSNSGSGNLECEAGIKAEQLSLDMSGSGNVTLATIETEDFDLSMSGSGNFEADKGYATQLTIHKSGSGNIQATGVNSEQCAVSMSGSGNAELSVSQTIQGNLSGSSNVRYKGDATVSNVKISGSGGINRY